MAGLASGDLGWELCPTQGFRVSGVRLCVSTYIHIYIFIFTCLNDAHHGQENGSYIWGGGCWIYRGKLDHGPLVGFVRYQEA